jgi:hypothetical protein
MSVISDHSSEAAHFTKFTRDVGKCRSSPLGGLGGHLARTTTLPRLEKGTIKAKGRLFADPRIDPINSHARSQPNEATIGDDPSLKRANAD